MLDSDTAVAYFVLIYENFTLAPCHVRWLYLVAALHMVIPTDYIFIIPTDWLHRLD